MFKLFRRNQQGLKIEQKDYYSFFRNKLNEIEKNYNESNEVLEEIMDEAYSYLKKISPDFYFNDGMVKSYYSVRSLLIDCEDKLPKRFIIETDYDSFYSDFKNKEKLDNEDYLLDSAVYFIRNNLMKHERRFARNKNLKLGDLSLKNYCQIISNEVQKYFLKNNIECYVIKIIPAYSSKIELYGGSGYHYFNIVKINSNYFLVDCTYRQFFMLEDNLLGRVGIVGNGNCNPGIFMMKDSISQNIADTILKRGWIRLNSDVLKRYLDAFTLSFRNGLAFENINDIDLVIESGYTIEQYINFLQDQDNMFNYEELECLGIQERPLEDASFKLKLKK